MRKQISSTAPLFPMPVLMVATYNEDDSIDVMTAAWGMMIDSNVIALNLTDTHKTVKNIRNRKSFTVSLADINHIKEIDYLGIVSANNVKDKFVKTGLTASKSELVDAPIINEFPICMECEYIEYQDNEYGIGVVGKIVNTTADDSILSNDIVDISKLNALAYDPFTNGYYKVEKRVGNAFKDGNDL